MDAKGQKSTALLNVSETCFFNREPDVEGEQQPSGLRNEANTEVPTMHFLKWPVEIGSKSNSIPKQLIPANSHDIRMSLLPFHLLCFWFHSDKNQMAVSVRDVKEDPKIHASKFD